MPPGASVPMKRWVDSPASSVNAVGGLGGDTGEPGMPLSVAERPLSVPAVALATFTCRYIACAPEPPAQLLLSTAAQGVTAVIVTSPGLTASASRGGRSNASATSKPSAAVRRGPPGRPVATCLVGITIFVF